MDLLQKLRKISKKYGLNKYTRLEIICVDGKKVTGYYDGYVSALDNEPETAQIDVISDNYKAGITGILETEIVDIRLIE